MTIVDPNGPVKQEIPASLQYARDHLFPYLPFHADEIFHLLGAIVYTPSTWAENNYADLLNPQLEAGALIPYFKVEFCRLHGWPKEDPLDVLVDLGSNGSLIKIDKARTMLKDRIGDVRTWDELPVSEQEISTRLSFSNIIMPRIRIDISSATTEQTISLRFRLSSLERASDRRQSTKDACVRTCDSTGQFDQVEQTWVSSTRILDPV
jgi:hypothetical protein